MADSDSPAPEAPRADVRRAPASEAAQPTVPSSGRRQAFRDIRRQLAEDDLKSTGVQKLLLDMLENAEASCEAARAFEVKFHEADKLSAVLTEKLRTDRALEIMFGVGVGLGGALLGVVPMLWEKQPLGFIGLGIGLVLVAGSTLARVVKK